MPATLCCVSALAHIEEIPMLAVGDIAPATEIATDTGRFSLAPHDGKKMVIFLFTGHLPNAII